MRQVLSTAAIAVVVSLLTLTVAGAMAQSEPDKERAVGPTGTNADRVDGKHAMNFTNARGRRGGKLVATNRGGWLPSNIVQPLWHLIKNKPAVLADGQVAWSEVPGKPPGFADNVDNAGVTKVTVTRVVGPEFNVPPQTDATQDVDCPPGSVVVGGGLQTDGLPWVHPLVLESYPLDGNTWAARAWNPSSVEVATAFTVALCLSVEPGGRLATAKRKR